MASSSSSSSSKPKRNYDVFLSFRGTDVRKNFLGHLYTALDQNGIYTYIDSEELRKGEQISQALPKAIEESQIAIIVFSKDYASSQWCLEEVAKIMECKAQKDMIVLPVFYKVEPREVRKSYGKAMIKHESKFGKNSEKVNKWKEALFNAGSLSGWDLNDGDEAKLIKRIVKEICRQLDRIPLHVAKHPVGIHPRVEKLVSMLSLESDDVLMIGLWGPGGIGKTTLAKALHNAIFRQFEGSCFLANVREASKDSKDLVPLQEKLLSKILLGKRFTVFSVDEGINLIQYRLCYKKVLLVLNDVNDVKQLNALAGDCEWFGRGSRIIFTTRDKHLLTSHGIDIDHIYEVKTLEHCEAFELFNRHAFLRSNKGVIQRDLVDSALDYANGLPLALEVFGSFLCGRGEREWKSALNNLADSPNKNINDVLKLSYEGLEDYAKDIFLDIACFFKGKSTEYIMKILDCCDFKTIIGVQVLIEKSLIIEENWTLQMHDLIQLMGMDIVKQECRDDPGRRSRIWLNDDIHDVLSGGMGTNAVKAIVLDLPKTEAIYIGPNAFKNMRRLRMLIMINVHNSFQGPVHLPNELRWFEWPECPPWIPEFFSGPKKLVGLDLHKSNIPIVREQFKDFKKLKFINLSECQSVVCMPDLDCTPNLEELDLHGCKNLERIPDIPDKITGLRKIYLDGTSIKELPASIENLLSLQAMHLKTCKKLTILPSSIYRLQNLGILTLDGCSKLTKFPSKGEDSSDSHTKTGFPNLWSLNLRRCKLSEVMFLENHYCFPSLGNLNLSGNNLTDLPTCGHLYELDHLNVSYCHQLQEILEIPGQLRKLWADGCKSLSKIPSNICNLDHIQLSSCHQLVHNGFIMDDLFKPEQLLAKTRREVLLPGGEMPRWLLPDKEGYIYFMASKDLYKKFLGLAFGVVFQAKDGERPVEFCLESSVNGSMAKEIISTFRSSDLENVWLDYRERQQLWPDYRTTYYWSHFQFSIRVLSGGNVKKCGFRLICKPLDYDLEVSLQDDQSVDPALLYEIWHENDQANTEEESSSELEYLLDHKTGSEEYSTSNLVHQGSNMADFSLQRCRYSRISPEYRIVRSGGEMPKEFVLVEDGTISFKASQDLYDKLFESDLCVAISVGEGKKEISFDIVPHVNGQRRNVLSGTLGSFDSDQVWIQFFKPNWLWGVLEGGVDFGQFEESYSRFSLRLRVLGGTLMKLGYFIRCRRLEDDLKVVLEDNQLVDPAALREDVDDEWGSFSGPYIPYVI